MVQKSLLQKWVGKPRSKQKLIWAVIILALGFVIYSLLIVGGVVFAFELANNVGQVILYLLGSLLFLGLLVVAVQEMIRAVKELRMLKREKVH